MLEHILSVKEAIAELEAVCQPGSVVVEDLMSVRQRGGVQHLGSGVSGQLAENKDARMRLPCCFRRLPPQVSLKMLL